MNKAIAWGLIIIGGFGLICGLVGFCFVRRDPMALFYALIGFLAMIAGFKNL